MAAWSQRSSVQHLDGCTLLAGASHRVVALELLGERSELKVLDIESRTADGAVARKELEHAQLEDIRFADIDLKQTPSAE